MYFLIYEFFKLRTANTYDLLYFRFILFIYSDILFLLRFRIIQRVLGISDTLMNLLASLKKNSFSANILEIIDYILEIIDYRLNNIQVIHFYNIHS